MEPRMTKKRIVTGYKLKVMERKMGVSLLFPTGHRLFDGGTQVFSNLSCPGRASQMPNQLDI